MEEDVLVSLFGPVLAKSWVVTITLAVAILLLEQCFTDFGKLIRKKKKRKKIHSRMRVRVVRGAIWPPNYGSLN